MQFANGKKNIHVIQDFPIPETIKVHLQEKKKRQNRKWCIKYSTTSSLTSDQQSESQKNQLHAALEHLTPRKTIWNTRSYRNSIDWDTRVLFHIRFSSISLWTIFFRCKDQNWKLFSVNFVQLLIDKYMNSGIAGKETWLAALCLWWEHYNVTQDWKQKEVVFCFLEWITVDCLTKFPGTGTEANKTDLLKSLGSTAGVQHFLHGGKSSPNLFPIRCERFSAHHRA